MTYSPMYSRQREDFVAAVTADVQPMVTAAEAAQAAAQGILDDTLAAPLTPTIEALSQATAGGVESLPAALQYVASGMTLDFISGYYRNGTALAGSLAALGIVTVTQAAETWAENVDGSLTKFVANAPRVTNKGLLIEAAATEFLGAGSDPNSWALASGGTFVGGQAAPDGTTTAVLVTDDSAATEGIVKDVTAISIPAGPVITVWRVPKKTTGTVAAGLEFALLGTTADQAYKFVYLDAVTGAYQATGGLTVTVTDKGDYWLVTSAITATAHNRVVVAYKPAQRATLAGGDSAAATGTGTLWRVNVFAGAHPFMPTSGDRAADVVNIATGPGSPDDAMVVSYGAGLSATVLRSAWADPEVFAAHSDGGAPWLNQVITRIELKPASAAGEQNTSRLKAAVRGLGFYPRPPAALAADDIPALTLGVGSAVSAIDGATSYAVAVPRTSPKLTYVSGVPMAKGAVFPQPNYFISRGAYYGTTNGTDPLRATGYFAYEFIHTGTQFEIPTYGSGTGSVNLRVLVNGCVAASLTIPNGDGAVRFNPVVFPAAGTRVIRIETGLPCNGVHVASAAEIASVERQYPLVTILGDSFLEGSGSELGDITSTVLARALGLSCALAAVGATGIINPGNNNTSGQPKVAFHHAERLKDLTLDGVTDAHSGAPASPALGLVFGSVNDQGLLVGIWGAYGATLQAAITNRCDAIIDAWVAARSGKPLVFFGPVWPSGAPNNRPPLDIYRIRDGMAEAAWARSSDNVWFIDRLMPSPREGVYSTASDQAYLYTGGAAGTDPTHPTPAGHRFDGLTAAAALRHLILSEFA